MLNLIIAGMTLGTAWAIRGQFGHEQGAAWAGAIGGLGVLLLSRREDWFHKMFKAALAAAIGWGLGGMMSYGVVVGYGRGTDFVNVYYGLLMLFIIGGLYGFIGGGLFGLVLTESKKNKIRWASLITQMIAWGIIIYFFFIYQWEWFMTPPRSELWAACFGMAIGLTWFMARKGYRSALRVAVFAGVGGGFGFAFGNFLMVLGGVSGIAFNFWNVMEYSLGFFGGAGMAYGVFTSEWETIEDAPKKSSNLLPLLLAVLIIPLIVWQQSFVVTRLQKTYEGIMDSGVLGFAQTIQWLALVLIIMCFIWLFIRYYKNAKTPFAGYDYAAARSFFIIHFSLYIVLSLLITGAVISGYRIEQYLYIVNLVIILLTLPRLKPYFKAEGIKDNHWAINFMIVLAIIALLAFIAINTHGDMGGAQKRFEF